MNWVTNPSLLCEERCETRGCKEPLVSLVEKGKRLAALFDPYLVLTGEASILANEIIGTMVDTYPQQEN